MSERDCRKADAQKGRRDVQDETDSLSDLLTSHGNLESLSPSSGPVVPSIQKQLPPASLDRPLTHDDVYALVAIAMDRQSKSAVVASQPTADELSDIVSQVAKIPKEEAIMVVRDYQSGNLSPSERSAIVEFAGRQPPAGAQPSPSSNVPSWKERFMESYYRALDSPRKGAVEIGAGVALVISHLGPIGIALGVMNSAAVGMMSLLVLKKLKAESSGYHVWKFNADMDHIDSVPGSLDREARTQLAFRECYQGVTRSRSSPEGGMALYAQLREKHIPLRDGAAILESIVRLGDCFVGNENPSHQLDEQERLAIRYGSCMAEYQVSPRDALRILSETASTLDYHDGGNLVKKAIALIESSTKALEQK